MGKNGSAAAAFLCKRISSRSRQHTPEWEAGFACQMPPIARDKTLVWEKECVRSNSVEGGGHRLQGLLLQLCACICVGWRMHSGDQVKKNNKFERKSALPSRWRMTKRCRHEFKIKEKQSLGQKQDQEEKIIIKDVMTRGLGINISVRWNENKTKKSLKRRQNWNEGMLTQFLINLAINAAIKIYRGSAKLTAQITINGKIERVAAWVAGEWCVGGGGGFGRMKVRENFYEKSHESKSSKLGNLHAAIFLFVQTTEWDYWRQCCAVRLESLHVLGLGICEWQKPNYQQCDLKLYASGRLWWADWMWLHGICMQV